MIFNNLIKERRDKKINSLSKEIQRKLKRFEELNSKDYQLQVIKPSNELPKEGDIFVLSPKKGYYFLESNIESSNNLMSGSHVVVIFSTCFNTMDIETFKSNYHELLTAPFIVNNQYWEKGYFYVIKHSPLSEEEKKLEIGSFRKFILYFKWRAFRT